MWESEGEVWSEDEGVSSGEPRGQCVQRCVARHRVAWAWWQGLSFLEGLGAGKGSFELPHGHGHAVPRNS